MCAITGELRLGVMPNQPAGFFMNKPCGASEPDIQIEKWPSTIGIYTGLDAEFSAEAGFDTRMLAVEANIKVSMFTTAKSIKRNSGVPIICKA